MNKYLLLLATIVITLSSFTTESAYTIDKLMESIETQVDKEVKVRGKINHVCRHSGKKCFIINEQGDLSMQIMAGGDIETFDKELVGSEIEAVGIVKERRIEKEQIDKNEQDAKDKMQNEESEESHKHCNAMLNNVKQMREWMEKNNKEYYAIYYIEGLKYEVVK